MLPSDKYGAVASIEDYNTDSFAIPQYDTVQLFRLFLTLSRFYLSV